MPAAEDLSCFFNQAEFADAAVLDGSPVSGLLDTGYSEAFGMASHDARFTLAEAVTTATTQASTLVVRSTTYRVRSVQPDGTGVCTLLLERQ